MDCHFTVSSTCMDCKLLPLISSSFHLPPSPQSSASPPAPPLLDVCSPSSSLGMPCFDIEPPASPVQEDSMALPPAFDHFSPSRPIDLSAPPWLLPPSGPPETFSIAAPLGSIVPPVPPWSGIILLLPRTCGPSVVLRPSTPTATAGSTFPSGTPRSQRHCLNTRALRLRLRHPFLRHRLGLQCQRCHSAPSVLHLLLWIN